MKKIFSLMIVSVILIFVGCNNYSDEERAYIENIENHRMQKDSIMEFSQTSPFNAKGKEDFHGLNYYDVDPGFLFQAKLVEFEQNDTIIIFGTKGEARTAIRFGYLPFQKFGNNYRLNVYKNLAKDGQVYFSTWFTDLTTGNETYGVGRYIEFEYNSNPNFLYTFDFNLAFNPFCAYSSDYSCAIPSKQDFINLAIEAGEKNYHD